MEYPDNLSTFPTVSMKGSLVIDETQLNQIQDPVAKEFIKRLANLHEKTLKELDDLRLENQRLKDEIKRLKGEQAKPEVKPSKKTLPQNHSSEEARKKPKAWSKKSRNDKLTITRTEPPLKMETPLPGDALFKGVVPVFVQNIKLVTETIRFLRNKFYSPSTGKTYLTPLPKGYDGQFGSDLKALALGLHHLCNVGQKNIHALLTHAGVSISMGQVSNLLIKGQDAFHREKSAIGLAGLKSAPWQQTDDTLTRVNGVNQSCHILGNPCYTSYTTLPHKDRLSLLKVFMNGDDPDFLLNQEVLDSDFVKKLPLKWRKSLESLPLETRWDAASVGEMANRNFPTLGAQSRKRLIEELAFASYRSQRDVPVISLLVSDDAPQFRGLTEHLSLCWVHAGRHFNKLSPHVPYFQERLAKFKKKFWKFYDELLEFKSKPSSRKAASLSKKFDLLFVGDTGYDALDARIAKTAANKAELLQVLRHPEIPLHNNASELAVRSRVRKRDVSFGPRTQEGVKAWDTFQTIAGTALKLGVNILDYLSDRVSGENKMPSLASLIAEKSKPGRLSGSWA